MSGWEERYALAMSGWHEACALARRGNRPPGCKAHLQLALGRWVVSYRPTDAAHAKRCAMADAYGYPRPYRTMDAAFFAGHEGLAVGPRP